jgi:hypothetical protein
MATQIPFTMGQQPGVQPPVPTGCWYRAPASLLDPSDSRETCDPSLHPYIGWTYTAQSIEVMLERGWEVYRPDGNYRNLKVVHIDQLPYLSIEAVEGAYDQIAAEIARREEEAR